MDEHRKYIERDTALERRFQPVYVNEPNEREALAILQGLKVGIWHLRSWTLLLLHDVRWIREVLLPVGELLADVWRNASWTPRAAIHLPRQHS